MSSSWRARLDLTRHVITGGTGFTGSYLAAALKLRGQESVVFDVQAPKPDHSASDFVQGDIRRAEDLARLRLGPDDVVYHLAARQFHSGVPKTDRQAWFAEVNVEGTQRLLEAMQAGSAKRLLFFSTDMTYGVPERTPVPPTHPQRPIGPYGASKLGAERLLERATREFGLRASVFRPRLISGAGRLGILTKLFRLVRANLPVPLIGSGKNRYQMVAVEDCVAAAIAAMERDCPIGPFNLGSNNPPTVRALLQALVDRAGSRAIVVPTPASLVQPILALLDKSGLTLLYPEQFAIANIDYVLDTSRTTESLGWKPQKSDEEILFEAYRRFTEMGPDAAL